MLWINFDENKFFHHIAQLLLACLFLGRISRISSQQDGPSSPVQHRSSAFTEIDVPPKLLQLDQLSSTTCNLITQMTNLTAPCLIQH